MRIADLSVRQTPETEERRRLARLREKGEERTIIAHKEEIESKSLAQRDALALLKPAELRALFRSLAQRDALRTMKELGMVDLPAGKTIPAIAMLHILIPNRESAAWGTEVEGELFLAETYGVKIKPARFTLELSAGSPAAGAVI